MRDMLLVSALGAVSGQAGAAAAVLSLSSHHRVTDGGNISAAPEFSSGGSRIRDPERASDLAPSHQIAMSGGQEEAASLLLWSFCQSHPPTHIPLPSVPEARQRFVD